MPIHDWTFVEDGIYHAFHMAWLGELQKSLNAGVLPEGFYALADQHAGDVVPDVLSLHESDPNELEAPEPIGGGVATLSKTKPKADERLESTKKQKAAVPQRRLAIRHVTGHRIVAFIELVSPSNKDRRESVARFSTKVVDAIKAGIHVLLVDPFPHGSSDPLGMHGAVWQEFTTRKITTNTERPLTLAAYAAGKTVEAFVNHLAVGNELPEMPVFLTPKKYVPLSLESTYMAAYAGMPEFWRKVIEKKPA